MTLNNDRDFRAAKILSQTDIEKVDLIDYAPLHIWTTDESKTLCGLSCKSTRDLLKFFDSQIEFFSFRSCLSCVKEAKIIQVDLKAISEPFFYHFQYPPIQATLHDWETVPMPKKKKVLPFNITISEDAYQYIKLGFIPREMEDRWFVYFNHDHLFIHRSWSGFCIFEIEWQKFNGSYKIINSFVNRNPEQYSSTDDDSDCKLLEEILRFFFIGNC